MSGLLDIGFRFLAPESERERMMEELGATYELGTIHLKKEREARGTTATLVFDNCRITAPIATVRAWVALADFE